MILTALAAVLAFIPLTHSVFWGSMAYTLIGGTAVGTVLILLFLPRFMPRGSGSGRLLMKSMRHPARCRNWKWPCRSVTGGRMMCLTVVAKKQC